MASRGKKGDRENVEKTVAKPTLALIATRPGPLQNGLVALMTTMPQVNAVIVAEEAVSALRMIAEHLPTLVLLEMALPGEETRTVLKQIKAAWPLTRCIVLANDVRQQQEAKAAGADVVLLKGFSAAKLIATVEELLSQKEKGRAK
jgi:DNA-binding NarL/FixJ family response regulator